MSDDDAKLAELGEQLKQARTMIHDEQAGANLKSELDSYEDRLREEMGALDIEGLRSHVHELEAQRVGAPELVKLLQQRCEERAREVESFQTALLLAQQEARQTELQLSAALQREEETRRDLSKAQVELRNSVALERLGGEVLAELDPPNEAA